MRPDEAGSGCNGCTKGMSGGFDKRLALQKATDRQRANLIADIVGHPKDDPSVRELDFMDPALKADAIRRHLGDLLEAGVVRVLVIESGNRVRGYPYKFYAISDEARKIFDQNGLFPATPWQRQYDSVQKPPEIREAEQMPRPSQD